MAPFTIRGIAAIALAVGSFVACAPSSSVATRSAPAASAAPVAAARFPAAPDRILVDGDVRLRYRDIGRGEPVVLIHGLTRDLRDWSGVADSLAAGHRVVAFDLRGSGQSTRFTAASRYGTLMSDDVIRLLDHLQIRRAHLIGHSLGGVVAANVAARHPDRIASATLIAPPSFSDSASFAQFNQRWIVDLESGAGLVRFLQWLFPGMPAEAAAGGSAEALSTNSPATLAATLRGMSALMVTAAQTRALQVPTLIAVGSVDPLLAQARELGARWPAARLLEIEGANHGDIVGHPALWAAVRQLQVTNRAEAR